MALSTRTMDELDQLAREMGARFTPPELIVGCTVKGIADTDLYAENNGWIEAVVGQHNQQRCRYRGNPPNVAVNDVVDVLYFRSYRLFVVFSAGGDSAVSVLNNARVSQLYESDGGGPAWSVNAVGELSGAGDIYPAGDGIGLHNRIVRFGVAAAGNYENWTGGTDDLSWLGWASYVGFVTPAIIPVSDNLYKVAHNAAAKAFRYRAADTSEHIYLRARVALTYVVSAGLMIDDGSDKGDGDGANNFYRVYMTQSTLAGPVNLVEQYRKGGGLPVTNTSTGTASLGAFLGLGLNTDGTRWSNWKARPFYFGESGDRVQFTVGGGSNTWTPARVGLYQVFTAVDGQRRALYSWYKESAT